MTKDLIDQGAPAYEVDCVKTSKRKYYWSTYAYAKWFTEETKEGQGAKITPLYYR